MQQGGSVSKGSTLTANDCRFEDNQASGVYARSSTITFEKCTFTGNSRCGVECFTSCEAHLCACQAKANSCSAVLCADSSLTVCSSQVSHHGMAVIDVRGATARAEIYKTAISDGKRSGM